MGFDTARYHDLPDGVDYASRLVSRVINAHGIYLLAFDPDAPIGGALRRDYFASPDQDIEHEVLLRIVQVWEAVLACQKRWVTQQIAGRSQLFFDTPGARKEMMMRAARQSCGR